MNKDKVYVVIMAGGIGSRFWPYSRNSMPKQFLDILGTGKSLLQLTYERFLQLVPAHRILVVTNEQYIPLVRHQLPDISEANILGEPMTKNTAPCVAYASYRLFDLDPEALCIVAPSDHLIVQEQVFLDLLNRAIDFASTHDALLTLGVQPNRPDTGYGYIQYLSDDLGYNVHKVKTFTEKPDLEMARQFLESGEFLWNSGIFIWQVKHILDAFRSFLPDLDELFRQGDFKYNRSEEKEFIRKIYPLAQSISIDYGIVEKATNVFVIPGDFGWSDLGTWKSLHDHVPLDGQGNAAVGKHHIFNDSEDCLVIASDHKLVVLEGVRDLYVVDTPDALLVCHKDKEQEVKAIVSEVRTRFNGKFN